MGTLRFDVRAVAESLPKAEKKEAFAAGKNFLKQVRPMCVLRPGPFVVPHSGQ